MDLKKSRKLASVSEQVETASLGAMIEHCVVKFQPVSILRNTKSADQPAGKAA